MISLMLPITVSLFHVKDAAIHNFSLQRDIFIQGHI